MVEGLDALTNLEELWLGKNKITKLQVRTLGFPVSQFFVIPCPQNLGALKSLRILALQSNRLTKIEGLDELTNLEELYFSHNGIERLEGLDNNVRRLGSPVL